MIGTKRLTDFTSSAAIPDRAYSFKINDFDLAVCKNCGARFSKRLTSGCPGCGYQWWKNVR
jgi:predicted Zn-ribbon and HTH transcriptional regulator